MSIRKLDHNAADDWNAFVKADQRGTFFHLAEWKDVLERAFGLKTFYLYEETGGKVTGVLPLALVNRPVFGPALISTPLCVYGGGLGECAALEEAAAKKAEELGAHYLELRAQDEVANDWPQSEMFFTFRRELSQDNEENLKAIPRKQRAEVRKGIAADLQTRFDQDAETFFKIYATSVRNLGTPVFSKKYLGTLIDVFGDQCEIATVSHADNPLTSVLSFKYKDQILPYYGGGLPQAREYSAYPFMYWKVMERAAEEGLRIFDFGRSMKDSGAYAFKKNFGFEPEALHYRYHLVKTDELPNMDPDSPRNKAITSAWSKLPLPMANTLGPFLYKVIM